MGDLTHPAISGFYNVPYCKAVIYERETGTDGSRFLASLTRFCEIAVRFFVVFAEKQKKFKKKSYLPLYFFFKV